MGGHRVRHALQQRQVVVRIAVEPGRGRALAGQPLGQQRLRLLRSSPLDPRAQRLPLPDAYREYLNSDLADLNNSHTNGFAGASVAGLFLDRFVGKEIDWAHFDTFAWRPSAKPGRPKGGEALGLRAVYRYLSQAYPVR